MTFREFWWTVARMFLIFLEVSILGAALVIFIYIVAIYGELTQ